MEQYEYKILSGVAAMTKTGRSIDWSATEQQLNGLIAGG